MTIENIIKVILPPAAPVETFDNGDWAIIEAELGTQLPQDYKDFVRLYGLGYFMEFLGINIPRCSNPNVRLERDAHVVAGIFRALEQVEDPSPYPFWPALGGLLACGGTDDGDFLFWLTRGEPEEWPIVVWDRGQGTFEAFECDLTDFLAGLATGEIVPKEFPEDLLPCACLFRPSPKRRDGEFSMAWRVRYGGLPTRAEESE